jgi:hypothetical protein
MAESFPTLRAEPTVGATVARTLDLAQRVAAGELRLLQLESERRVEALARRGAWVGFGALCLLLAWLALAAAAVVALEPYLPLAARLGLLAASQALLGVAFFWIGLRAHGDER